MQWKKFFSREVRHKLGRITVPKDGLKQLPGIAGGQGTKVDSLARLASPHSDEREATWGQIPAHLWNKILGRICYCLVIRATCKVTLCIYFWEFCYDFLDKIPQSLSWRQATCSRLSGSTSTETLRSMIPCHTEPPTWLRIPRLQSQTVIQISGP